MLSQPEYLSFDVPNWQQPERTHRMACAQWGNPDANETILCVHGLTRNGRDFDRLARALSGNYRVLCPDMPGRGKSQWLENPDGYQYPAYMADLAFMLHSLNISRLHWIGTSMGGILGMMMANTAPGLIRSLALNDIGCVVSAVGLKRIISYAGSSASYADRAGAEAALRERCQPFGLQGEEQWQEFFAHSLEAAPDGRIRFACDPAMASSLLKTAEEVTDINLWPLWEAVTNIPVLLLRGASSDILPHETAQEMQAKHPKLEYHEIADAGHAPALMNQDDISLIRDWLSKIS